MSALADIFTAVRLTLDGTGFEAQATALATKSGQNAGTVMGQQLSSKLKSAVTGAIGAGVGLASAAMLTGANQLDAATKQLQADTGMTAEAAKVAEHAMAGMYQNNLQGFDQIGKTMAVVINGLDLTGAAADAMTEKFLKFETATGQDSSAVSAFHEILNAWGLDASSATHIMDLLVASHQQYGSSIADNQASLQRLAPQMKAMNMTIDDTVNLLNLFDAAGLDASKAQFALNTAVKNLKPGQTFNDLIKQVTAIEDPTLRAQEAIKLFGARGGVGLANALKPGITSLADFATSASDTVGASDKAAAAVEDSFGNRATLLVRNFTGALAELGTNMGDLVMIAAIAGPGLTRGLLAGLGGLAGMMAINVVPQLAGALTSNVAPWMTAGTKASAIFGAGMTIALPLIAAAAVVAAWAIINDGLNKQAADVSTRLGEVVTTQTMAQLEQDRAAITKGMQDIINLPLGTLLYGDQLASLKRDLDTTNAAIEAATVDVTRYGDASLAAGILASKSVGGFSELANASLDAARAYVKATGASKLWSDGFRHDMQATAPALNTAQADFNTFLDTLGIGPARAKLQGELTGAKLAAGLKTGTKASRSAGAEMVKTLTDQLNSLTKPMSAAAQKAELEGELLALNHARGIAKAANDPTRMALIDTMIGTVRQKMIDLAGLSYSYGLSTGSAWSRGIVAAIQIANPQIGGAIKHVQGLFKATSPPGPESPLHEIDKWGARTGQTWVDNLVGSIAGGKAGIRGALGGLAMPAVAGGSFGMPYAALRPDFSAQASGRISSVSSSSTASVINLGGITVNAGSDVSPGAARRFGQAIADEVANVLQEQNARFTSRLRVARA